MSKDEVSDSQRRFRQIKKPRIWPCRLPEMFLTHMDEKDRELWVIIDRNEQQLEWLVDNAVALNTHMYHLETDVILNATFRKNLKLRMVTGFIVAGMMINILFTYLPKALEMVGGR